jgi:hypothetical protein
VDSVADPLFLRKSGSAGNRTRNSRAVARNSDHQTTEAVSKEGKVDFECRNCQVKYIDEYYCFCINRKVLFSFMRKYGFLKKKSTVSHFRSK